MAEYKPLRPIQPVSLPSFQYGLANVKAGRSGYQDLADALSQINPALQQFGRISRAKQQLILQQEEEERLAREAEIAKGREAFQLDPSGVSEQLKNLTRKGVNAGVIPESANAPFIIGGLQAQGEVLVNRDYRDQLRSLVETTTDPEVAIAQTKAEFLKRPEFSDPSVRAYAAEVFGKVDDEFRKDVNSRLDAVRTETNKRAWLELGRPVVDQVISGQLDVNDPNMIGWINHAAGVFEGSNKYAWDNLIKEDLKEGLSTGDLMPSEVQSFLNNLRELDLGGGIKFADVETGNAISDFIDYVDDKAAKFENRAKAKIDQEYNEAIGSSVQVFLDEWNEDGSISEDTFKSEANRLAQLVPPSKLNSYLLDLRKQFSNLNKVKEDSTDITYAERILELEQGKDLDELKNQLLTDVTQGAITQPQFAELNSKLESYRDFNNNFIKTDTYRTLSSGYEEVILGFRTEVGWETQVQNHFQTIGKTGDIAIGQKGDHLYGRIVSAKGESAAKIYLNNRYTVFKKDFRDSLKIKFDGYLEDGKSVEEARSLLINEAVVIGTNVFDKWSQDSITLATQLYGI